MIKYQKLPVELKIAEIETEIENFWKKNSSFEKSITNRRNSDNYSFYDGPPFANGLPHYGHLLTGYIKDVFARYHTLKGKKVPRKFGWDTHGLPVEMEIEKTIGVSGQIAINEYGIDKFNQHCQKSVMKYSTQWQDYVNRQGRWVDFEGGYKTMDINYMESVIWAFKELYKKGLIYQDFRVVPYSWACQTPLSNFETKIDNAYRKKTSKAITIKFKITSKDFQNSKILVWTTTPWTLPSNLALAVGKNILKIGPTGVGKTEVARRLAKLADAPFIKIEATKFTEVGYVGRDVDSIIRDLMDVALKMVRDSEKKKVSKVAVKKAKEEIIKIFVGKTASSETKQRFYRLLEEGKLDDREIDIKISENKSSLSQSFDIPGGQVGMINVGDMIGKFMGGNRKKNVKIKVKKAIKMITEEKVNEMIDEEQIITDAIHMVENDGIVFIDEIDKICTKNNKGAEVSREGVQRDLLPLVEGCNINTKYGSIKTDHILFIASGAFHTSKPSDLLPELQGRFPIRVKLNALTEKDLILILTEPKNSLIKQYKALMQVEGVNINFTKDGISKIANIAQKVNQEVENIGARRLHTLLEKILEDISFNAPEITEKSKISINQKYVNDHIGNILSSKTDLSKFIL